MISPSQTIILIPTYNEADNIALTLEQIRAVDPAFHVLVLDDNSPDGTGAVVQKIREVYPTVQLLSRTKDRGFAQSYLEGFRRVVEEGQYEVVVTMDADFSHEPKELPSLLRLLDEGADMALGSRYAKSQAFPHISLWRRIMSMFANRYVRFILQMPIRDCTAGYIAMRTSLLSKLDLQGIRTEGYGFLFELKYRAFKQGFRVMEHPVKWPERHQGSSKMNMRRIFESFLLPWKIRFRSS